jgi:hypothetical protein
MAELLELVTSKWNLLWVILVFGFAPGFMLRLIVMMYPSHDVRRKELVAELYTIPRVQRPLWVAEQLETALFEGLPRRVRATSARGQLTFGVLLGMSLVIAFVGAVGIVVSGVVTLFTLAIIVGLESAAHATRAESKSDG